MQDYTELIENILKTDKDPLAKIESILADRYKGRGPVSNELSIILRFCLRAPTFSEMRENLTRHAAILRLVVMDRELMVIEEVFREVFWNVDVRDGTGREA